MCVCVCVCNWVEQRCQLLWTCHVYFKVLQLLVLFLSRTSCFRSIPNIFYLKVSPLSTFTPVCYLSFGTLTYVTEQTHQILEMSFCMNERKRAVSDETRLWWTFFWQCWRTAVTPEENATVDSTRRSSFLLWRLEIPVGSLILSINIPQSHSLNFLLMFVFACRFCQVHFM